jgi:hypothetical protein
MAVFKVLSLFASLIFEGKSTTPRQSLFASTPINAASPKPLQPEHETDAWQSIALAPVVEETHRQLEELRQSMGAEEEHLPARQLEEMRANKPVEDALRKQCQLPSEENVQGAACRELACSSSIALSGMHVIDLTNDSDSDRGGHHLIHLIEGKSFSMTATMPSKTPSKARRIIR